MRFFKVKFSQLNAKERFTALQSGEVDILSRNTTMTSSRDAGMGLKFPGFITYGRPSLTPHCTKPFFCTASRVAPAWAKPLTPSTVAAVTMARVTYYDGVGFLVNNKLGVKSAKELDGATICIQAGTTTELNVSDYFRANNLKYTPITFDTSDEIFSNTSP